MASAARSPRNGSPYPCCLRLRLPASDSFLEAFAPARVQIDRRTWHEFFNSPGVLAVSWARRKTLDGTGPGCTLGANGTPSSKRQTAAFSVGPGFQHLGWDESPLGEPRRRQKAASYWKPGPRSSPLAQRGIMAAKTCSRQSRQQRGPRFFDSPPLHTLKCNGQILKCNT
jgi:hypothetical protein